MKPWLRFWNEGKLKRLIRVFRKKFQFFFCKQFRKWRKGWEGISKDINRSLWRPQISWESVHMIERQIEKKRIFVKYRVRKAIAHNELKLEKYIWPEIYSPSHLPPPPPSFSSAVQFKKSQKSTQASFIPQTEWFMSFWNGEGDAALLLILFWNGGQLSIKMVKPNIGLKLARWGDCKSHFLTLNELRMLSHVHLWVTIHPGLPETVPAYACLSRILINRSPFSFKNIFIWMINCVVIFNIYQNVKGISHLVVFNNSLRIYGEWKWCCESWDEQMFLFSKVERRNVVIFRPKNTDLIMWGQIFMMTLRER